MDTFAITILFISITAIIIAFVCGRSKDRCLKNFSRSLVRLIEKDGKHFFGELRVETSGIEITFNGAGKNENINNDAKSYILYKKEFSELACIVRCIDEQGPASKKLREKQMRKLRRSRRLFSLDRKVRNLIGTVRDSLMELITILLGRAKTMSAAGKMLTGQDKYVNQIQGQAIDSVSTSYEPIIERYIGRKVVLTVDLNEGQKEYTCVLKEYTPEFIEVLDVDHKDIVSGKMCRADLIVPRSLGVIRYGA